MKRVGKQVQRYVTELEVAKHSHPDSSYMILHGRVYDVTTLAKSHPGGPIIADFIGRDGTVAFDGAAHSSKAMGLLKPYYVGKVSKKPVSVEPWESNDYFSPY